MSTDALGAEKEGTSRLEAFSDAVIAIAMTLLVLEIQVPHVEEAGAKSLWTALLAQWPSYMSYLVSFLTLGIVWVNHHNMFKHIRRTNHTFLVLNVLLLSLVGIFPFSTALLADYIKDPEKRYVAAEIYSGISFAAALLYTTVWTYAARNNRLVVPTADPQQWRKINRRIRSGPLGFGLCFLLAFVNVEASVGLFLAIMLVYLFNPFPGEA